MRHFLPLIALLSLVAGLPAQAREANLERAANLLAGRLARLLPALDPVPARLALVPSRHTDPKILGTLTKVLQADGYEIRLGAPRRAESGTQIIHLQGRRDRRGGSISLEIPGADAEILTCDFGSADWVGRSSLRRIFVEGPLRESKAEAIDAAYASAWRRVSKRYKLQGEIPSGQQSLRRVHRRLALAWDTAPGGHKVYRALLELDSPDQLVENWRHQIRRRTRRDSRLPWLRVGLLGLLALGAGAGYMFTDWRTRGYFSGMLRCGFGILFLLGAVACWRVVL